MNKKWSLFYDKHEKIWYDSTRNGFQTNLKYFSAFKCTTLFYSAVTCDPNQITNSTLNENVQLSCNGYSYNDVCTYTCNPGYQHSGINTVACDSDGSDSDGHGYWYIQSWSTTATGGGKVAPVCTGTKQMFILCEN